MSPLASSIHQTLAFFDAQELPLTLLEIRAYLVKTEANAPQPPLKIRGGEGELLQEILKVLSAELSFAVSSRQGFYFLQGREHLPELRQSRYRTSLRRFRKAKKYLYFLRYLPFMRAVALSGSQALLNSEEDSDIDLFLITKKNRIWLTRLLVSLYFQVLGQRRYRTFVKNRFCLNHYLCESTPITQDRNLYTAVEYASLIPVLGEEIMQKFWRQNEWIREFLADPKPQDKSPFFGFKFSSWQKVWEILLEATLLAPLLNWFSGLYQKQRIRVQDYIIVSEQELSFHPGSRGQKVLAKYRENLGLGNT